MGLPFPLGGLQILRVDTPIRLKIPKYLVIFIRELNIILFDVVPPCADVTKLAITIIEFICSLTNDRILSEVNACTVACTP